MDIHLGKYNTTQELFLSKVGIANSYSEDMEELVEPFFVSHFWSHILQEKAGIQFVYIKQN